MSTTSAGPPAEPERPSIMHIFHRVNRVLPEDQEVLTIPPDMKAAAALALMCKHSYSQLPVVVGESVLGVFSYRSFAHEAAKMESGRSVDGDLTVEEFLEEPTYARVTDEFAALIEHLNREDAVLIGDPERLQGIVTALDVLRYLYRVASEFVLLEEIELALRALIRMALDERGLAECVSQSLSSLYKRDQIPSQLEEMTFNDYLQVVSNGRNWARFEATFGGSRERVRARLKPVCELRNDVFHFKREISVSDHEKLCSCRDWLLRIARKTEARRKEVDHD